MARNWLEEIVANKRRELSERMRDVPASSLRPWSGRRPDFLRALQSVPMGLIAEVKHRSPSAGVIRDPFDPAAIARAYASAGAQAVSVLMDETYFGGGEAHFSAVRQAVKLPMLYKEFVIDPWQIRHASSLGASAVLLIASVLDVPTMDSMIRMCAEERMTALVEVHDVEELDKAMDAGARCIGVNNRNLKTFHTSLDVTEEVAACMPGGMFLVSESGIRTAADVRRVWDCGASAVLVGEHLLRKPDLGEAVRNLMGDIWVSS